jgi:hypothetical protein
MHDITLFLSAQKEERAYCAVLMGEGHKVQLCQQNATQRKRSLLQNE